MHFFMAVSYLWLDLTLLQILYKNDLTLEQSVVISKGDIHVFQKDYQ